ncbi:MAG: hypothetical protein ACXVXC_02670 [Nocardioidaceae bacterium]
MATRDQAPASSFIGLGGLFVAVFLYGYSAIALPSWLHSLLMPVLWLVLFVLACAWFTPHPRRLPVLAAVALVGWFALMIGLGPTA